MAIQQITNFNPTNKNINFTHFANHEKKNETESTKVKLGVSATSVLGVATALALISKRQGFSLNPSKILKTPIKDWAIFKITNKQKNNNPVLDFKAGEILTLGTGSVLGGLAGGVIFDKKENFRSKCNEAISQMVGDIMIPLGFVACPTMLYKDFENLAKKETKHLKLKQISKFIQGNKLLKILCPTIASGAPLAAGIIVGNKTSNYINEKVNGVKHERKIKITDLAPHLDDVCLAVSLMAEKGPIPDIISRLVPIALTIAGIETGSATNKHHKG